MRRLLFATTNLGKLRELTQMASGFTVLSLSDVPGVAEVEEDAPTLEGNAVKKAQGYARASGLITLADDSGLCVDALDSRPGVHSARYAPGDDRARVARLLEEMQGVPDGQRGASFQCVLCLASPDGAWVTERGECRGEVLRAPRGEGGFGYDPVLWIPALSSTMAELTPAQKAAISHRGRAFARIRPHLEACGRGEWP
jgi:XTP/dITP diphosphohydrolase